MATFRGKGMSGHYCEHSVIQWNFIRVTSRRSAMNKKCNRSIRNWSFISAGLMRPPETVVCRVLQSNNVTDLKKQGVSLT